MNSIFFKKNEIYVLCISIFILLIIYFIKSYENSILVPTFHIDGAYQTSSSLFRLMHEQSIGKDFYFYLGIAPLYILYPLFHFMGENLFASQFSSYLTVQILFFITIFIILKLIINKKNVSTIFLTILLYICFAYLINNDFIFQEYF